MLHLQAGRETAVEALLKPVGVPSGWWSADLHVRTSRSRGCTVSLDDRVSAFRCDGIEAFVVADVGWRTDFDSNPLQALSGEEIEAGDGGRFTIFPVRSEPGRPGRGAMNPWAARTESTLVSLLEESPEILVQVVQPPWPDSLRIEAFELMTPDTPEDFGPRWDAWVDLLRQGRRVLATGGSHRGLLVEGQSGNPRTWIRLDSTVVVPRTQDVLNALGAGSAIVSKGPFIRFTLDGEEVGAVLTRSPGLLRGKVEVFAPSGVVVNRVTVYVNGVEDAVFLVAGENRPLRFSEEIEVNLKETAFVVVTVEARGEGPPGVPPVAMGGETRPIAPLAITNPIWVEIFRASG
jgi:hypothetical protein